MPRHEFIHGMSRLEIIKHIFKKILIFIFFFMRRKTKKGPKETNEK